MVLYINKELGAKEVKLGSDFEECVFAESKVNNDDKLLIGLFYRSESGTRDNNENLRKIMQDACLYAILTCGIA